MRYSPDHKQRSTQRILKAAAALFRKRGYSAAGIDAIMASAKLTAGSFYTHFRSKEDVFAQALDSAFEQSREDWPQELKESRGRSWLREFASFYLSEGHRDAPGQGCPMPALAAEIPRTRGVPRGVFEQHLLSRIAAIELQVGASSANRRRAISAIALCVGGLQLARAVKDPALSTQILSACRDAVFDLWPSHTET